jgi:hypothetical protein
LVVVVGYREVKRETAELSIPEPGKRIQYYGHVVRVERFIPRVKPVRIHGVVRYGAIQIVLPRDCVDRPAYVIVYVLSDREKLYLPEPSVSPPSGRTPLIKVTG